MSTKIFTHTVRYPPLTDLQNFMGAYKLLFESMNIPSDIVFPYCEGLSHPIDSEHSALTDDYMRTYDLLRNMSIEIGPSLCNVHASVRGEFAVFGFSYEE